MCGPPRCAAGFFIATAVWSTSATAEVQGGEAGGREILSALPADTVAVLTVRDLAECDRRLATLLARMGLPISPYASLKGAFDIVTGLDDHGSAAVALMPLPRQEGNTQPLVVLLPTSDPSVLMTFLSPQALENDYVRVTLRGREAYAAAKGGFVVFGPTLATVRYVLEAKAGLNTAMSAHQLKRHAASDVSIWVRGTPRKTGLTCDRFGSPLLRGLCNALDAQFPCDGIQLCTNLNSDGIAFELNMTWESGASSDGSAEPSGSLLTGLPDEPFAVAMGLNDDRSGGRANWLLRILFHTLTAAGVLEASQANELREAYERLSQKVARVASSISMLPEETGDTIGFAKIMRARGDARKLLDGISQVVAILRRGPFVDPRLNRLMERLEYRAGAESLPDLTIDHLALDLGGLGEIDHEMIRRVFGRENLLARIGLVDGGFVAVTFGGGLERFRKTAMSVRTQHTPLATHSGAPSAETSFSTRRFFEAYIAVDRLVTLFRHLRTAGDVSPGPAEISPLKAPVTITLRSVTERETQLQAFVPIEVVLTLSETTMAKPATPARTGS